METLSEFLIEFIASENSPLGLLLIAASAMIEYVFPPFPGDTITLFAAVLITGYNWSFAAVFGAVMAGSLAGSMAAFYFGGWLERRRARRSGTPHPTVERLVGQFRRYGAGYLVINRFLPGIRAVFFLAAGMAGMRPAAVLFYSAISAAAYNLALIALGSLLGANFDTLLGWVKQYTLAVWAILGAIALLLSVRFVLARRRRKPQPPAE